MDDKKLKNNEVTAAQTNIAKRSLGNKQAVLGAGILLTIILLVAGYFVYHHHHASTGKANSATQTYSYTYNKTASHSLAGASAGQGMSAALPTELSSSSKSGSTTKLNLLQHYPAKAGVNAAAAYMATIAYYNKPANGSFGSYMTNYSKQMQDKTSTTYKSASAQIQSLIGYRFVPARPVLITKVANFTNSGIQSNAWSFDFLVQGKQDKSLNYRGRIVQVYGQNATYYLLIDAIDYNWLSDANQTVWSKVFDSLKVDQ